MVWTSELRQLQSILPSIIVQPNRVLWTVFTPGISCQINQSEGDVHCSISRASVTRPGSLPAPPYITPQTEYKNRAGRDQWMSLATPDLSIPRNISLQHEQSRQNEASQLETILSTTSSIQTKQGTIMRRFGPTTPATTTFRLQGAKCWPWRIF